MQYLRQQEQHGAPQPWLACLSPQLNLSPCADPDSQDVVQLLEAAMMGAQSSQLQPQALPSAPLQTLETMKAPANNAVSLLQTVMSANTPGQFFLALDAYLGSALQYSTGEQQPALPAPSTPLPQQQQLQQQHSNPFLPGAASPSYLSSGYASAREEAAAAAAALPAGTSQPTCSDSSTKMSVQLPTITSGIAVKRAMRPQPLDVCKQQQHLLACVTNGSEPAPLSAVVALPDQSTMSARSIGPLVAPGSSSGLELRAHSLPWHGSYASNAQAALLADCCIVGNNTEGQQQQQQQYQLKLPPALQQQQQPKAALSGCKRRLETGQSPFAMCCHNSDNINSTSPQQQHGWQQQQGWQQQCEWQQQLQTQHLNVQGSVTVGNASEGLEQPPSPTTAAAAAARAYLQPAASSNLGVGSSSFMWQQQPQAAAAALSQDQQCTSTQSGSSVALSMSMQLMHYVD